MKTTALILVVSLFVTFRVVSASDPLIPEPLNRVLSTLAGGMTIDEAKGVISSAYPASQMSIGIWDGMTGYINFKLNERYTVSFSAFDNQQTHKTMLSEDMHTYIFDNKLKERIGIGHYK